MDLGFRFIKIIDICYVTLIYFTLGFLTARLFDSIFTKFDETRAKQQSKLLVILDAVSRICINAITVYIVRNIVPVILPSPFEGLYGFKQALVSELKFAPTFIFALLYYQKNFQTELKYIYNLFD